MAEFDFEAAFRKLQLTSTGTRIATSRPDVAQTSKSAVESTSRALTVPRRQPHHEVKFDYPALSLCPRDLSPYLKQPGGVAHRSKPDRRSFRLDEAPGAYSICLTGKQPNAPQAPLRRDVNRLFQDVQSAATMAGRTMLSVVSATDGSSVRWLVKRQTTFFERGETATQGGGNITETYSIADAEWDVLLKSGTKWLDLLDDLVHRKSDLAFLVVDEVLKASGADAPAQEAALWTDAWDSKAPRAPGQVLKTRLMKNLNHVLPSGETEVLLDCCCPNIITSGVDHVTVKEALEARCRDCGAHVLQNADDKVELRRDLDRLERQGWWNKEMSWRELDESTAGLIAVSFSDVGRLLLLQALDVSVESFKVPSSVVPTLLAPVSFEETSHARETAQAWIKTQPLHMMRSSDEIIGGLRQAVYEAQLATADQNLLIDPRPEGWPDFLDAWLRRAMGFLLYRKCDQLRHGHQGVHLHDDGRSYYQVAAGDVEVHQKSRAGGVDGWEMDVDML